MRPCAIIFLPLAALPVFGCAAQTGAPELDDHAPPGASAGAAQPETFRCSPSVCGFLPDLTVVADTNPIWVYDPFGPPGNGHWQTARGFDVSNIGGNAGPFTIAVYNGANSQSISVPGMAGGSTEYFQIAIPACGNSAAVVVNPWETLAELNYNNDSTSVPGVCP